MIVLLRFQGQNAQAIFESLIANYYFAIFGLDYICQSGNTDEILFNTKSQKMKYYDTFCS